MEKLWTTSEVARYLSISEADVEGLVQTGKLTGYKLAGQFLRFKPEQVHALKGRGMPRMSSARPTVVTAKRWQDTVRDFLYFYDFYVLSFVLLAALIIYLLASS